MITVKFYSAVKKKEILTFAGKWIILKMIILMKISQNQKRNTMFYSDIWNPDLQVCVCVCVCIYVRKLVIIELL